MSFAGIIRERLSEIKGTTRSVLLCILVECNHADNPNFIFNNKRLHIRRGDWVSSRKKIQELTGLTEQQVKTSLKNLKKLTILSTKNLTNHGTMFTVDNIDVFLHKSEKVTNDLTNDLTNDQPTGNQRVTINKKDNNNNNNNLPPLSPQGEAWTEGSLSEFYKHDERDKFKIMCIAIAEGKKFDKSQAEEIFNDFEKYWLSPALPASKSKKKNWKRAFQDWIRKISPKVNLDNLKIAKEMHQGIMSDYDWDRLIDKNSSQINCHMPFLSALNAGVTRGQINDILKATYANPPKDKIYSWGIITSKIRAGI